MSLLAVPLTDRTKGDVWYPGEAERFVAVPVAVNEKEEPDIVTGPSVNGHVTSVPK